nr:integrase, catalytic region, zinc finger, CCHC-type, peptidase aspartic, catalytic [Tanacetum cinerariifolium]
MVADLRYFNSLKIEVDSLKSQLETQKTQFLNEIDRLSREYYYADHMNTIFGVYTELDEKFLGTVKFGNDQIAPFLGYGDLVQGAVMIKWVYYVKGLNHNLFFVDQLCDADLEVSFWKSTCYIRDLKGNDLLTVIVDDYFRYTWTHFLRSKDETPEVLIYFLRLVQRGLHAQVRIVRTDKGTEFLNKTLHAYFVSEGILHQTSVAQTPEQNGVVERWNRTLDVLMSSAVTTVDAPNKCQQHNTNPLNNHTTPKPLCHVPPHAPTVTYTDNMNQAEMVEEYAQVENEEFINIFCTLVQDRGETSSRHVDSSNMHTFYQHHPSKHRWTKDDPLEHVIGNPSQSVRTRRQLKSYGKMCMFALTMSRTEPKSIKEAMADSAWIESMQKNFTSLID